MAKEKTLDTKSKIIHTSIELIGKKGLNYASAGNISKAGDFNKSIIFYYFENLEDLLLTSLEVSISELSPIFETDFENYSSLNEFLNSSIRNLISSTTRRLHLKVILSFVHQTMYFDELIKQYRKILLDDIFNVLVEAIDFFKTRDISKKEIEVLASLIMATFNGLGVILLIDDSNDRFIENWKMQVKLIASYI